MKIFGCGTSTSGRELKQGRHVSPHGRRLSPFLFLTKEKAPLSFGKGDVTVMILSPAKIESLAVCPVLTGVMPEHQ